MSSFPDFGLPRRSFLQFGLMAATIPLGARAEAPAAMLANVYRPGIPLAAYWVSEKYDGVRGLWDGQRLWTRGGEPVLAPGWFTAGWPDVPLDGELWAGRGAFPHAVSTARRQVPTDAAWRDMVFMVFDLPLHGGPFDDRIPALQQRLSLANIGWLRPVAQHRVADQATLMASMRKTVAAGGEGLVLHRGAAPYRSGRSDDLLKLKPFDDADAKVLAHVPGRGQYLGAMGALWVENEAGVRFKLGTGFSARQRQAPPPIGSWVTYRFRELNASGVPRFASFMRLQEDVRHQ
jgi:DNA ligase-1